MRLLFHENNKTHVNIWWTSCVLLFLNYSSSRVQGFSLSVGGLAPSTLPNTHQHPAPSQRLWRTALRATDRDDDYDDDDDDIALDDASLGDWRSFRASLIDGGLPGESSSEAPADNSAAKEKKKPSVAAQNEALLEQQNEALAEEYRTGVWAHSIAEPEVGGLLCRMPLEAELYRGKSGGYWKDKLDIMLSLEVSDKKVEKDNANNALSDADMVAQVDRWFAPADRMVARELQAITESGKVKNGVLNPNDLEENERLLLDKYLDYKQTWQEVCLVLSHNPESGCSEAVILNRPITKAINQQLATLLLEGSSGVGKDTGEFPYNFADRLVQAFGTEAGVYMGGPDLQDFPALLVHGIPDLTGARELSPGTGLYEGGWEAAVEGILEGKFQPLDFRFFLGRQSYDPKNNPVRGNLLAKVQDGAYQPVACARSLALKQCLGLPKPLWHEVLELCGGDLKALSTIELRKRADLKQ